ncbi:MAG: hypothetical protein ACYC9L_15065 [Sulfuricaulis sp.]
MSAFFNPPLSALLFFALGCIAQCRQIRAAFSADAIDPDAFARTSGI